jgi:hypothetical protein
MKPPKNSYLGDVTDAEWEQLIPYLTLMRENAQKRKYPLPDLFHALR